MATIPSVESKSPMQVMGIDEWVKELCAIPEKDFSIPSVFEFTARNAIHPETLQPYMYYAKSHYTRNLIHKCELFEVLAICWNVGQVSRIHNHRDQNCWMVTPVGRLRVQNFRVEDRDAAHGNCKLIPTDAYDMDPTLPVRSTRSTKAPTATCLCTTPANTESSPPTKNYCSRALRRYACADGNNRFAHMTFLAAPCHNGCIDVRHKS